MTNISLSSNYPQAIEPSKSLRKFKFVKFVNYFKVSRCGIMEIRYSVPISPYLFRILEGSLLNTISDAQYFVHSRDNSLYCIDLEAGSTHRVE